MLFLTFKNLKIINFLQHIKFFQKLDSILQVNNIILLIYYIYQKFLDKQQKCLT